jgi:hypothetical protein
VLFLAAALVSVCRSARAQALGELGVSERNCVSGEAVPSPELVELVRLELRADGVRRVLSAARPRERGSWLWIERGCRHVGDRATFADRSLAVIGYRDSPRERHLERSLSLADVPPALRERALALALAELFRAGEANVAGGAVQASEAVRADEERGRVDPGRTGEAAAASRPPNTPTSPDVVAEPADAERATTSLPPVDSERPPAAISGAAETRRTSPDRFGSGFASPWALAVGPALHALPANGAMLFGAEIAISWRKLSAGALGNLGSDSDTLGSVAYRRLHGFAAYELLSTDPALFRITAGLRAALGATFTNVTPTPNAVSQNATAASGDLALETGVRWTISPSWQTKLSMDIGYAFGPRIQADARELANFSGLFVGASWCVVAGLGGER